MKATSVDHNGRDGERETKGIRRIRLFLADSQLMFRECLKSLMASQVDLEVVGEAKDGSEACRKIQALKPDVAVLQLCLPGLNALQVVGLLKPICPAVKILILTLQEDDIYMQTALKTRVPAYVLRSSSVAELLLAIRKIAGGGVHYDSALTAKLLANRQTAEKKNTVTAREKQLLQLIGQGFSNKEIAHQVHLSVKTVEAYKVRFADTLGLLSRVLDDVRIYNRALNVTNAVGDVVHYSYDNLGRPTEIGVKSQHSTSD